MAFLFGMNMDQLRPESRRSTLLDASVPEKVRVKRRGKTRNALWNIVGMYIYIYYIKVLTYLSMYLFFIGVYTQYVYYILSNVDEL